MHYVSTCRLLHSPHTVFLLQMPLAPHIAFWFSVYTQWSLVCCTLQLMLALKVLLGVCWYQERYLGHALFITRLSMNDLEGQVIPMAGYNTWGSWYFLDLIRSESLTSHMPLQQFERGKASHSCFHKTHHLLLSLNGPFKVPRCPFIWYLQV